MLNLSIKKKKTNKQTKNPTAITQQNGFLISIKEYKIPIHQKKTSSIQYNGISLTENYPFYFPELYVDQEAKVKNYIQHLSQTLVMINDLACIRDPFPTGLLRSFEPGD